MSSHRAERFIRALETLEREGALDPMVELFADACEVGNAATPRVFRGKQGAREFWREYHGTLREVRSDIREVIESGERVVMEWETVGRAFNGEPVRYHGVSMLRFEGDEIGRFVAYFNPRELGLEGRRDAEPPRSEPPATAPA